ncbi:beta-lactamase/transpeptidase-like protein [Dothidotthia symphoricarpi CBS 119687]|uniref:Beta-lactamase/transpeptidase-like protein n=1 Tax=Dothidotthia symphoricarpi CBS 119687 TaxID=1392245 RepID=A0A6A6ACT2_9PLEO|nr:beta-lactamase/transpeptidase-like protein [Dothidotthia symphoricarpi CBS 119687]KAF2128551.1 beta-lactamase/transpeptidase-like protein [Dothidotthia symphoricarpi CBS 119687]
MADFETTIQQAVDAEEIPGCVLLATNRDGSFEYAKTFGNTSMKSENAKPLQLDIVMWVASCTKLMTSICALQLVECGKLTLDDPVYTHIPELKDFKILESFDDEGKPIEIEHTKSITLRTLLTHTSGLTYSVLHPKLLAWLAYHGRQPGAGAKLLQRYDAPLTFEPGESWMYGPGIDYAGLLIERVTGLSLEAYMRQNLWEPLGITDMTFRLSSYPDMKARMADMSFRDEGSATVRYTAARQGYLDVDGGEMQSCMGGDGVFTSAEEYIKVLKALLTTDEDEKLLKKDTLEEFFKPQLGEAASAAMNAMLQVDMVNNAMGGTQKDQKKDWGFGGLLLLHDQIDGKAAGSMIWGGLPNLTWWVDRKTGLCGLYAGQMMPTGDTKCSALDRQFEAGMYKNYNQSGLAGLRS